MDGCATAAGARSCSTAVIIRLVPRGGHYTAQALRCQLAEYFCDLTIGVRVRAVRANHIGRAADLLLDWHLRGEPLPRFRLGDMVARDDAPDLFLGITGGYDDGFV